METRRIQDMLLTINNSISDKAPAAIRDLITLRSSKYILRHDYILSLPKVNRTKYGLKSWRYFAAKKWNELANDIRIKAGTNEVKNKIRLLKVTRPSFFWGVPSYFEALWYPHLYFYRKSNTKFLAIGVNVTWL